MYTNKVKKIIFFRIPLSICNFRCHYCYLAQRDEHYQGVQPVMKYSPEQVALACSPKRLGGLAYFNFCADGETMLLKDLDLYVKELVKQGHFVEIITNMTITNMVDKFMEWPREMLEHVEFKCSFHYLELKKKKLLEVFAKNANQLWGKGASINIEVTPSDELIPYIEELKNQQIEINKLEESIRAKQAEIENLEKELTAIEIATNFKELKKDSAPKINKQQQKSITTTKTTNKNRK